MTVDEYETIRLIDLNGLTQEECGVSMNVARTTVQAIYGSARKKLAELLVNAGELSVKGGDYILCDGEQFGRGCGCCNKRRRHRGLDEHQAAGSGGCIEQGIGEKPCNGL